MDWLPPIKDAWWLYGAVVGLLTAAIRGVLRAHYYKEQIDTVTKHDKQISEIGVRMESLEKDTDELKQGVDELKESLQEHRQENRADIMAIMDAMLSLGDGLKKLDPTNPDFDAAHKKLRKRQLER